MPRARKHGILLIATAAALASASAPAEACTISVTGVLFGAYDPQSPTPDDGTGSISVTCHPSVQSPNVALGPGSAGSFNPRRMTGGATSLDYNLYTNSARTIVWGDGSGGTSTFSLSGGGVSAGQRRFNATIYGRVPALQNVSAGAYQDTLMVTVTF